MYLISWWLIASPAYGNIFNVLCSQTQKKRAYFLPERLKSFDNKMQAFPAIHDSKCHIYFYNLFRFPCSSSDKVTNKRHCPCAKSQAHFDPPILPPNPRKPHAKLFLNDAGADADKTAQTPQIH